MRRTPKHVPELAYCEHSTANASNTWHIRRLTAVGLKVSGGTDTAPLCGMWPATDNGWDISRPVVEVEAVEMSTMRAHWGSLMVCPKCVAEAFPPSSVVVPDESEKR